MKENNVVTSAK